MSRKRHEILGKELHVPLSESLGVLGECEKDYELEITTRPLPGGQQYSRASYLGDVIFYAVLEHLGFGPIDNLKARIDRGVDEALDYFLKDWWRANKNDVLALDKSRRGRQLQWFEPLKSALLLGGLAGRWDDIVKICSWFDETIELQYQARQIEDEYMVLFLCIVSNLRAQPFKQADKMLEKVKKCRTRRPKLLCAAWEAAVAKDQKAFDKAFKDSVAYYVKSETQDVPNVCFWVALDPSIVWLIAEHNGLKFPELPEELDAAVVRRQTIGLA